MFFSVVAVNVSAKNIEFVNSDGSKQADICIAATISTSALNNKMKELNYNKSELRSFTCNGLPLNKFAKRYKEKKITPTTEAVQVYSFHNTTESDVANLCIAAATSNAAYMEAKSKVKKTLDLQSIACNRMSLRKFAKKYGNKAFKI